MMDGEKDNHALRRSLGPHVQTENTPRMSLKKFTDSEILAYY